MTETTETTAVIIPARAGSRGVPGKNLLVLAGKPLVTHVIDAATSSTVDAVYVSTDCERIAGVAKAHGARVIMRSPEVSADDTSTEATVLWSLERMPQSLERLAIVQCTSPLTTAGDISRCLQELQEHDCAFTAAPFHGFVWETRGQDIGAVNFVPKGCLRPQRQERSEWVETGGVYAVRVAGFLEHRHRYFGSIAMVQCPVRLEIDEPQDVPLARWWLRRRMESNKKAVAPYLVAEIGVNHMGSLDVAKRLVSLAASAGFNAVKFQARTPELCVPREQWDVLRDDPWHPGNKIRYIDYRKRMEFDEDQWRELVSHCNSSGVQWFASSWDVAALDRVEALNPAAHKVASALLTDHALLRAIAETGRPIIMSTGMSSWAEIDEALQHTGTKGVALLHSTSAYPCPVDQLNLEAIRSIKERYGLATGYSGHERGWVPSTAAIAMGADIVERHVTLSRDNWGTDQPCSLEPHEMMLFVKEAHQAFRARGDGNKGLLDIERDAMSKLRRYA